MRPRVQAIRPPKPAVGIAWPEGFLLVPEERIDIEIDGQKIPLYDCEIVLADHAVDGPIRFRVGSDERSAAFELVIDGNGARYAQPDQREVVVHMGKKVRPLADRFKEDPPHIYFADGDMLVDRELFMLPRDEEREPFDLAKIEVVAWTGVDITKESQGPEKRADSIQRFMIGRLRKLENPYEVIFDDDGSGEAADIVAMRLSGSTLIVDLYHCKYSADAKAGARLEDLYEICGQAQKCVRWREKPDVFLKHLARREGDRARASNASRYEQGSSAIVAGWLNRWQEFSYDFSVTIVQPGLAKSRAEAAHLELLSATESFLMDTWGMRFRVLASA